MSDGQEYFVLKRNSTGWRIVSYSGTVAKAKKYILEQTAGGTRAYDLRLVENIRFYVDEQQVLWTGGCGYAKGMVTDSEGREVEMHAMGDGNE